MKKYTNKILIITAIVVVLGLVIGYTIDFQTGYRSGRIKYKKIEDDSLEMVIKDNVDSLFIDENDTDLEDDGTRCSADENNNI